DKVPVGVVHQHADVAVDRLEDAADHAFFGGSGTESHHAAPNRRGIQAVGSSPTSVRISSSMRTVRSRPDRTVSRSRSPLRLRRATTLSAPCFTRKQREVSGRVRIRSNSWPERPKPLQYSFSCAF